MVLFEYRVCLAEGETGENDEFSISIYSNGVVKYKTYTFSGNEISCDVYQLTATTLKKAEKVLAKERHQIKGITNNLSNGSYDGYGNHFTFEEHKIVAWNILKTTFLQLIILGFWHREQYCNLCKNLFYENFVLNIFKKISTVLMQAGIGLDLYSVQIKNKVSYKF